MKQFMSASRIFINPMLVLQQEIMKMKILRTHLGTYYHHQQHRHKSDHLLAGLMTTSESESCD